MADFDGIWHCTYWYPSNETLTDEPSEYDMKVVQTDDRLIFESIPKEDGSYLLVRLYITDDIATGAWYETTAPKGEFKGAEYSGAGQLIIAAGRDYMEGKWAGAGYDHKLKEMRVYTGNWELRRISDN